MDIKEKNYWPETVSEPAQGASGSLPDKADVTIVGGGFCGLSAARTLAQRGVRVVLLEAETLGWGASSRNGGMVLPGLKLPVPTLIKRYGREIVRQMYNASVDSIDLVEKIVREEGIDCNFARCGQLEVACKQSHFDAYATAAARIKQEFGREIRVVPRDALKNEIGSKIYYGGLVDEISAGVNPARYVHGLAKAAQRHGACLYDHTRVNRVTSQANGTSGSFCVETTRGSLTAKEVFLASGAYTTGSTPALRKKVIPIGSYIITTEVLPDALAAEVSPRNRMIYDSKHFLYYYRLTPDNRMLFGGRAAFFPESESTVRESAELLRQGMVGVYPQLRDTKVEYVWGGTLDFAFDVMPHSGKIDGMHFALGFAGHGVAAATWMGAKMAGIICGDADDNPFSRIAFPGAPIGLRSGHTWALPLAGAYYKMLDWFT